MPGGNGQIDVYLLDTDGRTRSRRTDHDEDR